MTASGHRTRQSGGGGGRGRLWEGWHGWFLWPPACVLHAWGCSIEAEDQQGLPGKQRSCGVVWQMGKGLVVGHGSVQGPIWCWHCRQGVVRSFCVEASYVEDVGG